MNTKVKNFIKFFFPGSFVSNEIDIEIIGGIPENPENAFAYQFFSILEKECQYKGKTYILKSEPMEICEMVYIGKEYTLDQIKKSFPNHEILISNLETNGFSRACLCRTGNWQSLNPEDKVETINDFAIDPNHNHDNHFEE